MDILHSNWLIQMLKKSGKTPQARLLSLFDILNDWTDAPGISALLNHAKPNQHIEDREATLLKTYLGLEAAKAGAALPEMLATQLYFMALSAMHEKLLDHNNAGLIHAKSAAEALITAQTKKEFHISRTSAYTIAASFIGALVVAGGLSLYYKPNTQTNLQIAENVSSSAFKPVLNANIASPQSTAALVAQIEQMRNGNCQLLEAIQLPDKYKSIYFQNIVLGQISTDPSEQNLVRELLSKIRCNYTPMLMEKST
jgi:hypothetical protein